MAQGFDFFELRRGSEFIPVHRHFSLLLRAVKRKSHLYFLLASLIMKIRQNLPKNSFNIIALCTGFSFFFLSCKSLDPTALLPLPQVPPASSYVNVPVEIPTNTLTNLVNQVLPPRLFNEKGMDMGNGIVGDVGFERNGMIQLVPLDSQRLQVTFPIRVRGEVGLKPGGLRNLFQSKIPIDQALSPVVVINPQLNPNWTLGISEFELMDLGGKIGLSALGMEIDLSSMVRNEIREFARQNLTSKPDLINLKPVVESIWNQVGRPVTVDLEGKKMAFSIRPDSVKIREYLVPSKGFHLDLGLSGKVQTHPASAAPSRPSPLSKITSNQDPSNRLEINIPLHLTYGEMDQMIQKAIAEQVIRINKKYLFQPSNFRSRAYGDRLGILMDFIATANDGEQIGGEFFLVGKPVFDESNSVLAFEKVDFALSTDSNKARLGAQLKRGKISNQLNQKLRFSLQEVIQGSLAGVADRLSIQTPYGDLKLDNLKVSPGGFYPTATGMDIQIKATGQVNILWK